MKLHSLLFFALDVSVDWHVFICPFFENSPLIRIAHIQIMTASANP